MQLDKKKYRQKEVLELLSVSKIEYEEKLAEQKSRIIELSKENSLLKSRLDKFKEKEKLIASSIEDANKTALEITEKARLKYSLEVERLRAFSNRWEEYFCALKEKYPVYKPVVEAVSLKERLDKLLFNKDPIKAVSKAQKAVLKSSEEVFSPKQKIAEYIAATEDSGFNMNDVLNPGELHLEDLCKELGLMDSNE